MIDAADISNIKNAVRDMIRGRESNVTLYYESGVAFDVDYDIPIASSGIMVPMSGVVGRIAEEDRLLSLSGHLKVGDTTLTFYRNDIVQEIDLSRMSEMRSVIEAPTNSGKFFIVEAMTEWGIGEYNKVVFGMVAAPSGYTRPSGYVSP